MSDIVTCLTIYLSEFTICRSMSIFHQRHLGGLLKNIVPDFQTSFFVCSGSVFFVLGFFYSEDYTIV